ncbi:MAG TPA: glycosyltransferase family 39 protein [Candidatus Tectomicrobia bacterium]|nr:glycosyltransferase family 39 protein [Candidatus Tectomicrobia bacterium]
MLASGPTTFSPGGLMKAFWLFLGIFCIYMLPSNPLVWGDTIPNRILPLRIIREFDLTLDEFVPFSSNVIPYFMQYRNGHFVSSYPVAPAILAVPFYVIPVILGVNHQSPWIPFLDKFSASSIALLSAVFLYLALKRITTEKTSLVITGIYALCTSTFSISSQALWQHGPSQLFLSLGLYFLIRALQDTRFIPWSGLPLGAAIVSRPTDVLMVLPVFAYICCYHHKLLVRWVLLTIPPLGLLLSYNYLYLGSIFDSGYGTTVLHPFSTYWSAPFLYGLSGVLASPSKGLFIYSPILLFAFVGIYWVWRHQNTPLLRFLSLGPILVLILYGKWHFWWGGETYGPRLVADISPFLSFYLFPVWQMAEKRRILKGAFGFLAILSLLMHTIGVSSFDPSWYKRADVIAEGDRLWSWRDSPFVYYGHRLLSKNISFLRTGISALPASSEVPQALTGSLVHHEIPSRHQANEPLTLSIAATNTGPAIWLFQTNNGKDAVRLGWRWLAAGTETLYSEGRVSLIRDVFPGEQEQFKLEIWPPSEAGQYTLVLGMVNEPTTWFAIQRFPVHIVGNCYFEDVLAKQLKFIPDSPHLTITPDKVSYLTGQIGKVSLSIANGNIPRNLKFFQILRLPDGRLRFLNSNREMPPNPPCSRWIRTISPHILSKQFKIDWHIGLQLKNMPEGLYTLYAFMVEPGSIEIVAKSSSMFQLIESTLEAKRLSN